VIIVGSQVLGILGMIISVPAASIFKLAFTEFYNHVVDFRS
jgi:predicted PurR-regulated permease PerM